ncbi:MAG: ABC transporter substrate-binding protein [Bacillota bacterium]
MKMKRLKRICFLLIALLLMVVLVASCAPAKQTAGDKKESIKIGAILPLSGWGADYGDEAQKGINLAVAEFNNAGGINGKEVVVLFEDSAADAKQAVSGAKKLIEIDKVRAIVGVMFSHEALAIAPMTEQNKVPLICGMANHPDIALSGEYNFVINESSPGMVIKLVDFLYEKRGMKKLGVLAFDTDYGHSVAKTMDGRLKEIGGELVITELYPPGTSDFKSLLLKVKSAEPDVLMLVGSPPDTIQIIRQMSELGLKIPVAGSDMIREKAILDAVGKLMDGVLYYNRGPETAEGKEAAAQFLANYSSAYGEEPRTVTPFLAYEGAKLALTAIAEGGETGPEMQQWLASIKNFIGANGEITMDENGAARRPIVIQEVRDGKFDVRVEK